MSNNSNRSRTWVSLTNERLIHNQRLRLAIVNMIVLALIWGILSLFVYVFVSGETNSAIDSRLEEYAFNIINHQVFFDSPFSSSRFSQGQQDLSFTIWIEYQGQLKLIQGSSVSQVLLDRLSQLADTSTNTSGFYNFKLGEDYYRIYQQPVSMLNQKFIVQTSSDIGPELEVVERLLLLFGFAGGIGIILTVVGGYALGRWTLRPLMDAREREKEFVADVSHELRTPLSVMQTNLELMLRHVDDSSDDSLEWVEPLYKETIRMRKMVDDLLDMAKIDAGMSASQVMFFSMSEMCNEVVKLYEPVFSERGIHFHTEISTEAQMLGDSTRLRQLLFILLDNAIKYTQEGKVTFSLLKKGNGLEVNIVDTGIGIPAELLPRVTERFFRADLARTQGAGDAGKSMRSKSSAGLGMAIAKSIVEAHQGKMTITSEQGKGTTIHIRFSKSDRNSKKRDIKSTLDNE